MGKIIRKNNKQTLKGKQCPFFQGVCKLSDCAMYHNDFDRCNLDLTPYNLFLLTSSIDKLRAELQE